MICFVCFLCVLCSCIFCVLFRLVYIVVYFLFVYNFTNHRHQVETQFDLINIITYSQLTGKQRITQRKTRHNTTLSTTNFTRRNKQTPISLTCEGTKLSPVRLPGDKCVQFYTEATERRAMNGRPSYLPQSDKVPTSAHFPIFPYSWLTTCMMVVITLSSNKPSGLVNASQKGRKGTRQ